jgi:hypothetical protein
MQFLAVFAAAVSLLIFTLVGSLIDRINPIEVQPLRLVRFNLSYTLVYVVAHAMIPPIISIVAVWAVNIAGGVWILHPEKGAGPIFGFLCHALDLMEYLFHRVQHSVPIMWSMHSLHHSDAALNATTTVATSELSRVAFTCFTLGSPTLRVGLFAFLASSGAVFAVRAGLKLEPHGTRHPVLVGLAAALFVALAIALIGVLFRNFLPASYVEIFRSTRLSQRLTYFMPWAFNENVFYRLFLFSALTFVINKTWRKKSAPRRVTVCGLPIPSSMSICRLNGSNTASDCPPTGFCTNGSATCSNAQSAAPPESPSHINLFRQCFAPP